MSEQEPTLDPAREQRLRALLADLGSAAGREADQLPPEVAARLEDTLAGLVAERGAPEVVHLPLRQRWMPRVAVAAAAVIVLGLGGLTAANLRHHGAQESGTSADAGAGTGSAESKQAPQAQTARLPALHSTSFARDVRVLLDHSSALRAPARLHGQLSGSPSAQAPTSAPVACPGPTSTDASSTTVVELDASPAALVVHPARKGARLVEAWSCDGARRLASTTVAP